MSKELYVGSLSFDTTEYDLEKLFSVSGRVTSVHLICDNVTGQFKGCGYVRMSTEAEAKDAINSLDGALLIDRKITVSEARPQKLKPQGGGYKGKSGAPKAAAGSKGGAPRDGFAKPAAAKTAKPARPKTGDSKPATAKTGDFKSAPARTGAPKAGGSRTGGAPAGKPRAGKR